MALTPTQIRAINLEYLGTEPDPDKLQNGNHYKAYTWYSAMCDHNDSKEYLVTYLEATDMHSEAEIVKQIPATSIPLTLGWQARMQTRGVTLNEQSKTYFETTLGKLTPRQSENQLECEVVDTERVASSGKDAPNVQDFINEKIGNVISDIDYSIDQKAPLNVYDFLLKQEFSARFAGRIVDHFQPKLQEFRDALSGDDDVLEGYSHMTRPALKQLERVYTAIVDDAKRYGETQKKARKPYKKRAPKLDKILKTFKYQKDCSEYKLASIDPSKILGKEEVWLFNTKYLTLTVLRSIDRGGLQIKGTSILNYDEKNSVTKKIGRKTEVLLKQLLDGGKRVTNKLMDNINAVASEANNRCGENTIIVKVY